jgi:hypothetical protein
LFKFAPIKQWRRTVPKLGLTTQTKVWTDKVEEEGKKPKASTDGSLTKIIAQKKNLNIFQGKIVAEAACGRGMTISRILKNEETLLVKINFALKVHFEERNTEF